MMIKGCSIYIYNMDTAVNVLRMQLRESRFRRELDTLIADDLSFTAERREQLELILSTLTEENDQRSNKPSAHDKLIEDMQVGLFKKPWRRLPVVHKRMLFDSYLRKEELDNETHNALMSLFMQRLNEKKYNSDSTVKYSIQDEKIIAVNDFVKNEDGEWVFVDKVKKTKAKKKEVKKEVKKEAKKKSSSDKKTNTKKKAGKKVKTKATPKKA